MTTKSLPGQHCLNRARPVQTAHHKNKRESPLNRFDCFELSPCYGLGFRGWDLVLQPPTQTPNPETRTKNPNGGKSLNTREGLGSLSNV